MGFVETTYSPFWRKKSLDGLPGKMSLRSCVSGCKIPCKWLVSGDIKSHLPIFSPKKLVVGLRGISKSAIFGFVGIHQGGEKWLKRKPK
jgi:hypothetical protein